MDDGACRVRLGPLGSDLSFTRVGLAITAWDKKVDFVTNSCSGINSSAPSGLNGLTRTVWTGVTHLQRFGSVGKRITRSRARLSTGSTQLSDR